MGRDGKPLKSELMQALWLEQDAIKNVAWLTILLTPRTNAIRVTVA